MATWKAFLENPPHKDAQTDLIVTLVHYYDADDAANAGVGLGPPVVRPAKILHVKMFAWPTARVVSLTAQQRIDYLVAAVVAEGQQARATKMLEAAMTGRFPFGSTLVIP